MNTQAEKVFELGEPVILNGKWAAVITAVIGDSCGNTRAYQIALNGDRFMPRLEDIEKAPTVKGRKPAWVTGNPISGYTLVIDPKRAPLFIDLIGHCFTTYTAARIIAKAINLESAKKKIKK